MMRFILIGLAAVLPVAVSSRSLHILGKKSSARDGAESRATCPPGYVVSFCEVRTGHVQSKSDGAFVDPNDGRVCVAVNGARGSGAIAYAVCKKQELVANPCKNKSYRLPKFLNVRSRGRAPRARCPPGYQKILCNAWSPWTPLLHNKGVQTNGVIPNNRVCAIYGRKNWCEVTAVCQIKNHNDFKNDVCKVIVGKRSRSTDDAYSRVTCQDGYVVTHCEVQTGNVPSRSDGAFIYAWSGEGCVAVNGAHGSGVIARATCSRNTKVPDPCNPMGPYKKKFLHLHSRGANPSVACPRGYHQILCNARSPWSSLLVNKGVNSKGIISNYRRCSVSRCSHRNWCEVTAVCRINARCRR